MKRRNSSWVVAPMQGNSPRARAPFSSLAASWAPSPVDPAPTRVWISSRKTTSRPPARRISSLRPFSRSDSEPRSEVPARRSAVDSSTMIRFPSSPGADSSRCATPSTTAVLPTPGSPTRQGLLVRRLPRTSSTSSISRARPMTGSSRPSRARAVRFRPSWARSGKSAGSSSQGSASPGLTTRRTGAGAGTGYGAGWGAGSVASSASPSPSTRARGEPSGRSATVVGARGGTETGAGRAGTRASRGPSFRGIRPLRK